MWVELNSKGGLYKIVKHSKMNKSFYFLFSLSRRSIRSSCVSCGALGT